MFFKCINDPQGHNVVNKYKCPRFVRVGTLDIVTIQIFIALYTL